MRAELTELFIASRHTRLHLASSNSSCPRGGRDGAGCGARQGTRPPGEERRAGGSLEGKEGHRAKQRREAKRGEWYSMQGGEEQRAGGQREPSQVLGKGWKLKASKISLVDI